MTSHLLAFPARAVVQVDQWSGVRREADPLHSASADSPRSPRICHLPTLECGPPTPGWFAGGNRPVKAEGNQL